MDNIVRHPTYLTCGADLYGNIYTLRFKKARMLKAHPHRLGYLKCHVLHGGTQKYVHRVVYECFNGLIPDGLEIFQFWLPNRAI